MRNFGATLLRVALGAVLVWQGYLALLDVKRTAAFLLGLGLPVPTLLALTVIVVHGAGGIMIAAGLLARAAASANAVVLLVGLLAIYLKQGALARGGLVDAAIGRGASAGYEYVALLVAATLAVALPGGGPGAGGGGRAK